MPRGAVVDLLAEPADADIDGAVAVRGSAPPDPLQQLVPARDPALVQSERVEQPELRRGQPRVLAVDEGLYGARVDPQLLDHELLAPLLLHAAHPAPRCCLDAGH